MFIVESNHYINAEIFNIRSNIANVSKLHLAFEYFVFMKIYSKLHFNLPNEIIMADFYGYNNKVYFQILLRKSKEPFSFSKLHIFNI